MGRLKDTKFEKWANLSLEFIKRHKWKFLFAGEMIIAAFIAVIINSAVSVESKAATDDNTSPVYIKQAQMELLTSSDEVSIYSFTAEVINVSADALETEPSIILARAYSFEDMDVWLYPSNIEDNVIVTDASVGFQIAYGKSDIKFGHISNDSSQELYAYKFMTAGDVLDGVGISPVTGVATETASYNKDLYAFRDIINLKIAITGTPDEVQRKLDQLYCLLEIKVSDVNNSYSTYMVSSEIKSLSECFGKEL